MIQYRNVDNWKLINYQGHNIKGVYSSLGKVWPTIPSVYKWLATYNGGSVSYADCDGTSAITSGEVSLENLVEISVGDCVTSLGDYAFLSCSSLSAITIPDNVTNIGDFTFGFCSSLTSIDIPSGVTSIGNNTFQGSSLTSITIPNSVTSIGVSAFYSCYSLSSATIGNGVTSLGNSAFYGCGSLTSIDIPNSVTSIGENAFSRCSGLTSITVEATVPATLGVSAFTDTNDCPIYVPCGSLAAYQTAWSTYASRLQCIPTPTFDGKWKATYNGGSVSYADCDGTSAITRYEINLTNLVAVEIGECVTSIGANAFREGYLSAVTFPNTLETIGYGSFLQCNNLTSITIPNSVTSIGGWAFYYNERLKNINIPDSVTSINGYTFALCYALSSCTISANSNLTSIGEHAFYGCSSLTSINIPSGVTSFGNSCFSGCTSLTSINIPSGVTAISESMMCDCRSLTNVTIPMFVMDLGAYSFRNCTSLQYIICEATQPPQLHNYVFAATNNCPIYVPCGSLAAYQTAWSEYSSRLQCIPTPSYKWSVNGGQVSAECDASSAITYGEVPLQGLYEVQIGDCVTSIDQYAFGDSTAITSITMGSGVTSIGAYAFMNSNNIQSITIKATTPPSIGELVFGMGGGTSDNCPIYVPAQSVSAYQTAWSSYASRIQAIQ